MVELVNRHDVRSRILHLGVAVGVGGLLTGVALGAAANARASGLGVAPSLASNPLHLRSAAILLYGCVALLIAILWPRLRRDTPVFDRLQDHVRTMLILCAAGPVLLLVANYAIVTDLLPGAIALLPGLVSVALAALYALVVHRLSGTTGVGLGARLMLRTSYVWLLVAAAMQLLWIVTRVSADAPDLLWFTERPSLEVAIIGFGITASLGVLLTNLNSIYHSRDMTQTLVRSNQGVNGLTVLWGLSLMWALRFPGGYQGLVSAVIGVALLIQLAIIASSSGLLEWRKVTGDARETSGDGIWAGRLASMVMLLIVITGLLIGASGVVLAAKGERPPEGVLAAEVVAVGLGVVPLAVAAALAPLMENRERPLIIGGLMIASGVLLAVGLWSFGDLLTPAIAVGTVGAEVVVVVGLVFVAVAARAVERVDM